MNIVSNIKKGLNKRLRFLLPMGLGLFLAACGVGSEDVPGGDTALPLPPQGVEETQAGGHLVWLSNADANHMDPQLVNNIPSMVFQSQVYEGLVTMNQAGDVVPVLAESFYPLEPTVWQFNLRSGVYFHDGTPFNAEAVVVTFNRFMDPAVAAPGFSIIDMVTEVIAIDEYTVHFHTEFPFAPLPGHLTIGGGLIVSPTALAAYENGTGPSLGEAPVGTGPFIMESRVHGDRTVFVRNENYWGGLPSVETLTILVIPEPGTRLAMMEAGDAHGFHASAIDIPAIRLMSNVNYFTAAGAATEYIGFNMTEGHPLSNLYLRQAISNAIDRTEMIVMMEGLALPATSMAGPHLAFAPTGLELKQQDMDAARELMSRTPWADSGLTLNYWYNEGSTMRSQIGQLLQFYLAELGITINITALELGHLLEAASAGEHDIFALNFSAATGDADRGFHPLLHSDNHGMPGNRFFYASPVADDLIDRARQTTDPSARYALYEELAQVLAYDVPMLPLWHMINSFAYTNMEGLQVEIRGIPNFTEVTILN
ncbi:MAG: ABC transporter substrate-binding protein [Defluviitaleaceae bacterium]|nr:ABC transporter substrate-binding protein [Defluviitaleaceae bacterium]